MAWRYDAPDNTIEVIVDPDFGGDIIALASLRPVWIVDTAENRPRIDASWRAGQQTELFEVSRCRVEEPADREGSMLEILGALDDHYGRYDFSLRGLAASEQLNKT